MYEEDKEVDRNKEIFKDIPIISIKIIKITDKINEFIVSDNKANVFIIRRENSFFTWKFKQERIDLSSLNIKLPIYAIDYYNIDTNEDISNQNEQNLIFIFLSANQINILKLKPEISNLLTISTSIENVNLTYTLESIGYGAFNGCTNLKSVKYDGQLEQFKNLLKERSSISYFPFETTIQCVDITLPYEYVYKGQK